MCLEVETQIHLFEVVAAKLGSSSQVLIPHLPAPPSGPPGGGDTILSHLRCNEENSGEPIAAGGGVGKDSGVNSLASWFPRR